MIVTLFTKEGCGLCEEAEEELRKLQKKLRFDIDLQYVERDPALLRQYGDRVPVVTAGAEEVSAVPLDGRRLRELLARKGR